MKFLYWLPSVLFLSVFGFFLLIFHVFQVIALRLWGYQAHKRVVDALLYCLNMNLWLVGSPIKFDNRAGKLPTDRPLIIVSNHQGMFDIPAIGWVLRDNHPKYIAKKSLEKGIPSISYNLRQGGSVVIDRQEPKEALDIIKKFTTYLNTTKRSGVIFPEGTRSHDGAMKRFKASGLLVMLAKMPDAVVVPVVLDNFWKIERYRLFPVPFGLKLKCTVLPPIEREGLKTQEIILKVENAIRAELGQTLMTELER